MLFKYLTILAGFLQVSWCTLGIKGLTLNGPFVTVLHITSCSEYNNWSVPFVIRMENVLGKWINVSISVVPCTTTDFHAVCPLCLMESLPKDNAECSLEMSFISVLREINDADVLSWWYYVDGLLSRCLRYVLLIFTSVATLPALRPPHTVVFVWRPESHNEYCHEEQLFIRHFPRMCKYQCNGWLVMKYV